MHAWVVSYKDIMLRDAHCGENQQQMGTVMGICHKYIYYARTPEGEEN